MIIFFIVTILSWCIAMTILVELCDANWAALFISIGLPVVEYTIYNSAILLIMTSITEVIILSLLIKRITISKRGKH